MCTLHLCVVFLLSASGPFLILSTLLYTHRHTHTYTVRERERENQKCRKVHISSRNFQFKMAGSLGVNVVTSSRQGDTHGRNSACPQEIKQNSVPNPFINNLVKHSTWDFLFSLALPTHSLLCSGISSQRNSLISACSSLSP
jgi:hypothetical protein